MRKAKGAVLSKTCPCWAGAATLANARSASVAQQILRKKLYL